MDGRGRGQTVLAATTVGKPLGRDRQGVIRQVDLIRRRSETAVKNQFYSVLRRGLRKVNNIIKDKLKRFREIDVKVLYKIIEAC